MEHKPIYLDGVDVSGCKYLPYCNDKQGNCAFEPNCYFKQLARKTQECNRYRKALEEIEEELKEDMYCESQKCGCDDFEECLKCTKEHILDIISRAKGEE